MGREKTDLYHFNGICVQVNVKNSTGIQTQLPNVLFAKTLPSLTKDNLQKT